MMHAESVSNPYGSTPLHADQDVLPVPVSFSPSLGFAVLIGAPACITERVSAKLPPLPSFLEDSIRTLGQLPSHVQKNALTQKLSAMTNYDLSAIIRLLGTHPLAKGIALLCAHTAFAPDTFIDINSQMLSDLLLDGNWTYSALVIGSMSALTGIAIKYRGTAGRRALERYLFNPVFSLSAGMHYIELHQRVAYLRKLESDLKTAPNSERQSHLQEQIKDTRHALGSLWGATFVYMLFSSVASQEHWGLPAKIACTVDDFAPGLRTILQGNQPNAEKVTL